jgi:hypothetical protein
MQSANADKGKGIYLTYQPITDILDAWVDGDPARPETDTPTKPTSSARRQKEEAQTPKGGIVQWRFKIGCE